MAELRECYVTSGDSILRNLQPDFYFTQWRFTAIRSAPSASLFAGGPQTGSQRGVLIFDTRVTLLNLTYAFGNQKLKGKRQRRIGSDDETRRSN